MRNMNNSTIEGLRAQRDALKEKAVIMCALSNAVSMFFRSPEGRAREWIERKVRMLYEVQCDMESLIGAIEALPKEGELIHKLSEIPITMSVGAWSGMNPAMNMANMEDRKKQ